MHNYMYCSYNNYRQLAAPSLQVKLPITREQNENPRIRTWLQAYSFRRIATVEQLQLEQTHTHTHTHVSFTVSLVRLRLQA